MTTNQQLFASNADKTGFEYINYAEVDLVESAAPRFYSATGYGMKIPTAKKLKHNGRLYRVYVAQFSNCGSAYIIKNGKRFLITQGA